MTNSSNRNPKALKDFIQQTTSHLEMDRTASVVELEESMKSLRNLSAEEKTEIGLLKSRIDEQSRLIMILKQRGDDFINKNMTLEKLNQELIEKKDFADEELSSVNSKLASLQEKFNFLDEGYRDLVKLKDEYRDKATELAKEKLTLVDKLKYSRNVDEINEEKRKMNAILEQTEFRVGQMENRCLELENELSLLKSFLNERDIKLKVICKEMEVYQMNNDDLKKKLQEANDKHARKVEALQKEKQELLFSYDNIKKVYSI